MRTSRRRLLVGTGELVAVTAATSGVAGLLSACGAPTAAETVTPALAPTQAPAAPSPAAASPLTAGPIQTALPWRFAAIDPVSAAERGYAAYSAGGCMYGSCEGVVGTLREKVGPPYDTFPTAVSKYGKAGVNGWGTLCGALNGACVAMYLAADPKTADALIDQLFQWYGEQALPDYTPKAPKFKIVSSVARSPLCHASVTTWCNTSGFKALSPERAERCAQLTASVAKKTAELLNTASASLTMAPLKLSKDVTDCLVCHGKDGKKENVHMSRAIDCAICHDPAAHK